MALGVPDQLYWAITPAETRALLREMRKVKEADGREAAARAGLVAAAIYNNNPYRRKGARLVRPTDFVRQPPKRLTPTQLEQMLDRWARSVNRGMGA